MRSKSLMDAKKLEVACEDYRSHKNREVAWKMEGQTRDEAKVRVAEGAEVRVAGCEVVGRCYLSCFPCGKLAKLRSIDQTSMTHLQSCHYSCSCEFTTSASSPHHCLPPQHKRLLTPQMTSNWLAPFWLVHKSCLWSVYYWKHHFRHACLSPLKPRNILSDTSA